MPESRLEVSRGWGRGIWILTASWWPPGFFQESQHVLEFASGDGLKPLNWTLEKGEVYDM